MEMKTLNRLDREERLMPKETISLLRKSIKNITKSKNLLHRNKILMLQNKNLLKSNKSKSHSQLETSAESEVILREDSKKSLTLNLRLKKVGSLFSNQMKLPSTILMEVFKMES